MDEYFNTEVEYNNRISELEQSQEIDRGLEFLNEVYQLMMEVGDTRTAILSQTIILELKQFGWAPSSSKIAELRAALVHRHWQKLGPNS